MVNIFYSIISFYCHQITFCYIKQATLDRLAKLKVTCSAGKLRGKLDLLGEKHNQVVFDIKSKISLDQQNVAEIEARAALRSEICASADHIHTEICTRKEDLTIRGLRESTPNMQPGFAIIFDNIDGKLNRRHMRKDNQNVD